MTRTNELVDDALRQPSMRGAALNYAALYGNRKTVDIIDRRIRDLPEMLQRLAHGVSVEILTKHDPNQILTRMLDGRGASYEGPITFNGDAREAIDEVNLRLILGNESANLRFDSGRSSGSKRSSHEGRVDGSLE